MRLRILGMIALILLILAGMIFGPGIVTGYNDLHTAQTAASEGRFSEAAAGYESAADHLFWRADLWEQAGLAAQHAGQVSDVIRLLEIGRQKNSLSPAGWDLLGSAYWQNQDKARAFTIWQMGSKAYPSYAPLMDRLVMAYDDQGNLSAEKEALVARINLADNAPSHYRLGLLLTLSDPAAAQKELDSAAAMDAEYKSAVQTLTATLNIAALDSQPAARLVVIGRGLGLVNEWGLAAQAFEQATEADANNAEAWAWLGEARQHTGQDDGSVELNKALDLGPRDPVIRGLRGLFWKRRGDYSQALAEYLQAALIEPQNPAWQASIGDAYTQTGDLISALTAYQKATELSPNDAAYWRLLAMFCADNNVQVMDTGLPAAKQAAELAPDDPLVLDALGWSYLQAGYLYNAQQTLLKAVQAAPDYALAHLHLAETYLRSGDKTSALTELNLARQLDGEGSTGKLAAQLIQQYFP